MARSRGRWVLAGLAGTVVGLAFAYLIATGTDAGRSWLLSAMLGRAAGVFKGRGTLSVGKLRVISPSYIKAERVALLDSLGVPVVRAEFLEGTLNARGLFSKAIHIRSLALRNVRMDFRQDFKGPFNIKYIISGDTSKGPSKGPGFGDDIRIDTLQLTNGVLTLISPWSPNAVFTGSARDSVIAVRDSLHDITRTPLGLLQRRVVTLDRVMARNAVITAPNKGPASMRIDTLRGRVSDPPIVIAAASGGIRWTGDSLKFDLPELRLPASSGSAVGAISWNQPGPLHYDALIKVKAGLSDLGWIWDVLPESGGGTATVRMRTLASADDAEYTLSSLDVSTMESRITGDISVVTRPASLELRGVDLSFAPLGSDLLRRLSYESVPPEVDGVFTGRLVAADGGPLTAFKVDRLDARFVDSNVPGAVSGARLSGLVSLGASPAAWNARVDDARIDLRSMRALLPDAPAVDGTLAGSMRITAADLRSADVTGVAVTWTDGAGNVSRVNGSARVRYADKDPAMTLDLALEPLSTQPFPSGVRSPDGCGRVAPSPHSRGAHAWLRTLRARWRSPEPPRSGTPRGVSPRPESSTTSTSAPGSAATRRRPPPRSMATSGSRRTALVTPRASAWRPVRRAWYSCRRQARRVPRSTCWQAAGSTQTGSSWTRQRLSWAECGSPRVARSHVTRCVWTR
ncbi:MAG: hypothetical protein V4617_19385 [Gemmatimonadota bacterium]